MPGVNSLEPTSLAGIVIEGPRGEVIASSGSFLDQDGRYYSTATARDERRDLVISETAVTEMSNEFTSAPPYPTRLRVYSYATLGMTISRAQPRTNGPFPGAKTPYQAKHSAGTLWAPRTRSRWVYSSMKVGFS